MVCPVIQLKGGKVMQLGSNVGAVTTFKCNSGLKNVGGDIAECLSSGEWSGRKPECKHESKLNFKCKNNGASS